MAAVNKPVLAERTPTAGSVERVLMAIALIAVTIGGVVGVAIAHDAHIVGIALIAGGLLCAGALC